MFRRDIADIIRAEIISNLKVKVEVGPVPFDSEFRPHPNVDVVTVKLLYKGVEIDTDQATLP